MKDTRLAREKRIVARVLADVHTAINLLTHWADRTLPDDVEAVDLIVRSRACVQTLQRDLEPEP